MHDYREYPAWPSEVFTELSAAFNAARPGDVISVGPTPIGQPQGKATLYRRPATD